MMMRVFNFNIPYPGKLKTYYSDSGKVIDPMLYNELRDIAFKHAMRVSSKICKVICHHFPDIQDIIDQNTLRGFIDEIVKNILDSVNNAKTNNPDLHKIEIKLSIKQSKNKLQIKISDNGAGFAELQKSKQTNLSDYLQSRNPQSFWSTIFPFKKSTENSQSRKTLDKQQGKIYLMGGQGVGLSTMDKTIKAFHGSVKVKNRKTNGASLKIELPYHFDDDTQDTDHTTTSTASYNNSSMTGSHDYAASSDIKQHYTSKDALFKTEGERMDAILEEMDIRDPLIHYAKKHYGTYGT